MLSFGVIRKACIPAERLASELVLAESMVLTSEWKRKPIHRDGECLRTSVFHCLV